MYLNKTHYDPRIFAVLCLVVVAALMRFIPHEPNFTPIIALAIFSGAHLKDKKLAFTIPIFAVILSDIFLGFHSLMFFVYLSLIVCVMLGLVICRSVTLKNVILSGLASSLLFFIVTNFGVFLVTDYYPHSFQGLVECYTMAIPFFRNTILSTAIFMAVLFYVYHLLDKKILTHRSA